MDNTSLNSHSAAPGEEKEGRAILQLIVRALTREEMVTGHWNCTGTLSRITPSPTILLSGPIIICLFSIWVWDVFFFGCSQNPGGGFINVYEFILINQSHWVFAFASCLLSIVVCGFAPAVDWQLMEGNQGRKPAVSKITATQKNPFIGCPCKPCWPPRSEINQGLWQTLQ